MYCSHCGRMNDENGLTCAACGKAIGHMDEQDGIDQARPKGSLFFLVTAGICALYLVNPTWGVFELIPDNFPVVGNLDEAAATTGLLFALSQLGLNPFSKSK